MRLQLRQCCAARRRHCRCQLHPVQPAAVLDLVRSSNTSTCALARSLRGPAAAPGRVPGTHLTSQCLQLLATRLFTQTRQLGLSMLRDTARRRSAATRWRTDCARHALCQHPRVLFSVWQPAHMCRQRSCQHRRAHSTSSFDPLPLRRSEAGAAARAAALGLAEAQTSITSSPSKLLTLVPGPTGLLDLRSADAARLPAWCAAPQSPAWLDGVGWRGAAVCVQAARFIPCALKLLHIWD